MSSVIQAMIADGLKLTWEVGLFDILGAEILHLPDRVILHNTKYLNNVYDKFSDEMARVKGKFGNGNFKVPCLPDTAGLVRTAKDDKAENGVQVSESAIKAYQRIIGVLLYCTLAYSACVLCNPDGLFTVCLLSQANSCPTQELYDRIGLFSS